MFDFAKEDLEEDPTEKNLNDPEPELCPNCGNFFFGDFCDFCGVDEVI